jgi:hypothetical protein
MLMVLVAPPDVPVGLPTNFPIHLGLVAAGVLPNAINRFSNKLEAFVEGFQFVFPNFHSFFLWGPDYTN